MTQVSIEKAVGPLLSAVILGLVAWFIQGGDVALILTPLVGLLQFGAVYFTRYNERAYNKVIAAVLAAAAVLLASWLKTGTLGQAELFIAIQLVVGALLTNYGRYITPVSGDPQNVQPTGRATGN